MTTRQGAPCVPPRGRGAASRPDVPPATRDPSAHDIHPDEVRERHADALLSSGGPRSVNEPGAPVIDAELLQIAPPTRGRCMLISSLGPMCGVLPTGSA